MGIEYKDNKKCRLVVYAGSDAYGKPKRYYKTVTYTSARNAEKQYRAFEREVLEGLKKDSNVKLSKMMDDYIESRKRRGVRSTTLAGYNSVKTRITETIGDPVASKVTKKMIDDWIRELDKKLQPKTVKNIVCFLSACYQRYIELEILDRNPCKHADLPEQNAKDRLILKEEDILPFYEAMRDHYEEDPDFVVVLELALFCGLRRSEILGLRKSNIDTVSRTVHIEDARHRVSGQSVTGEGTKTARSNRVLSLPEFVYDDIIELISTHEQKMLADRNLPITDYLILGVCGEPINPDVLYKRLKRFEKKYGLPPVNLHGLRHTYASMLRWLGRDLVEISPQLGHSQQSTTLNIYTHMFQDASIASRSIARDIEQLVAVSE